MNYIGEKSEIEKLETMIAKERAKRAELCTYLMECDTYVLSYDPSRDENERLDEVRYYVREAEDTSRQIMLVSNRIAYLENKLEIMKK